MTGFIEHTEATAPEGSARAIRATTERLGYLPSAVGRLATAPGLLTGFLHLSQLFETSTLAPLQRETVVLCIAVRNGCEVCVAMHTARLTELAAAPELIAALRAGGPLPEGRLEALRVFTVALLERAGNVHSGELTEFLRHGYTHRQALEVVLGIGAYTMSTIANTLSGATVDPQLAAHA